MAVNQEIALHSPIRFDSRVEGNQKVNALSLEQVLGMNTAHLVAED